MISPAYCQVMARYNAWQNRQLAASLAPLSEAAVIEGRGAFFSSILGTLNHLMWGDGMWMARFDGGVAPNGGIPESAALTASRSEWLALRGPLDQRISDWAQAVDQSALDGDLTWYSGAVGREMSKPFAECVAHFFNHQTHHRGQVHALLTAAGASAPVTDLPFMPEDV